jgi:hypothetical protein
MLTTTTALFAPVVVSPSVGAPDVFALADAPMPADPLNSSRSKPQVSPVLLAVTVTVIEPVETAGLDVHTYAVLKLATAMLCFSVHVRPDVSLIPVSVAAVDPVPA